MLIALVLVLLVVVIVLLFLQLRRSAAGVPAAVMNEKLSQLAPVVQVVNSIQLGLAELQAHAKARQDTERQIAESIRRLDAVISGTQSKGAAGENLIEAVFARLPAEWQVRNFRVGNKTVEFALRLPNNLILPIDSKWAATHLVEKYAASDDPEEQQRLKSQIEVAVLDKAREVKKYLDPNVTVSFGVAVVPDAVFDLCAGMQSHVFRLNVVIVSYSMFVPYLLLVFQTALRSSQSVDLHQLDARLKSAQEGLSALRDELEGRFARAITMLANSRSDMSVHLSRVSSGLTSLQISAGPPESVSISGEGLAAHGECPVDADGSAGYLAPPSP